MFSFLKGTVDIDLENYNYKFGETISGKIILNLKKDFFANSISIRLIGEKKTISNYGNTRSSNKQRFFDLKIPLDGKKVYKKEESPIKYEFKIDIPSDLKSNFPTGDLGKNIVGAINMIRGNTNTIRWFLFAKLDVSKSLFDISKKVQINIT
jgi:hypothetical protein